MNKNLKIIFLGSGNMAEAIISGLLSNKLFDSKNVFAFDVDAKRLEYLKNKYGVAIVLNEGKIIDINDKDIIVLSVKPKDAQNLLSKIKIENKIVISIMAGIKISAIKKHLNKSKIARVMPNTPALIGKGISGLSFDENFNNADKDIVSNILKSIGEVIEIDEIKLDAVTALSGSGPAYVFYLAEAMIKAGIKMGLDENVSKKLTINTIIGAGLMMSKTDDAPEILRAKVTSKGGTTEAAINVFDSNNMQKIILEALNKAKEKSIEMSK